MKWKLAAALVAVLVIAGLCAENRSLAANQRATLKENERLRAVSDAALHSRDTIKARNAEREIGWQKGTDSLRRVIATIRSRGVVTRADTVLMPVAEYVYITDTLVRRCEECAARLDSAIAGNRLERDASSLVITSQQVQIDWWVKHDKPHHSTLNRLRDRFGVTCGYGIQKVGSEVHAGPQCGATIRLLP